MSGADWVGAGLLLAPAAYAVLMVRLHWHWQRLVEAASVAAGVSSSTAHSRANATEELAGQPTQSAPPTFTVIIAARNEAANLPALLADLRQQSLPAPEFAVIVVDDHSTDGTAAIISQATQTSPFQLQLLQLAQEANAPGGKKAALSAALAQVRSPWVVCTDADCRLPPGWLAAYAALLLRQPEARFIAGPVLLTGTATLLQKLVGLEFAGLVGVGAATLAAGQPTMCNGANLAYRLDTFRAVKGFAGNEQVASGDDEFLLHKVHAAFPGSVQFLASPAAVVRTAAPPMLRALLRQRVRWASKWQHYQSTSPRRLAVLVLAANVALAAGFVAACVWPALGRWVAAAWALKLAGDVWFLWPVLGFFGRRCWLALVPLLQLAYGPYALGVGMAGLRGGYEWKGRAVR